MCSFYLKMNQNVFVSWAPPGSTGKLAVQPRALRQTEEIRGDKEWYGDRRKGRRCIPNSCLHPTHKIPNKSLL